MLQHEIDHLDGVLILDRTERGQRKAAMRALREGTTYSPSPEPEPEPEPERRLRVVYLGTSPFAAAVLRRLAESAHRPELVVTPPDRRQGRGRRVAPAPAAAAAAELGIPVLRTEATEGAEAMAAIRAAEPELGVVCAFGQLIREPLLSELELLNVHPSLLPRWRGAAPIERAIMAGDAETGVCVMRVTAGLDSGPVALVEREPIEPGDDFGDPRGAARAARRRADRPGAGPARRGWARARRAGRRARRPTRRRSPRRIGASTRRWRRSSSSAACGPFTPTSAPTWSSRTASVSASARRGRSRASSRAAGWTAPTGCASGCAEGVLRLLSVRPAGGRMMEADAFLRGHSVPELA